MNLAVKMTTANGMGTAVSQPILQRKCACGNHTVAGGECAECRKRRLQRKTTSQREPQTAPPLVHEVLQSPGQPLDPATRAFMEPRFGHDFSRVRVYTDAKAAESAQAVNALAYTVGPNVVFGAGQYAPHIHPGRHLLAHELTHVIQQSQNSNPRDLGTNSLRLGSDNDDQEQAADRQAALITQGRHVAANQIEKSHGQGMLQRETRRRTPVPEPVPDESAPPPVPEQQPLPKCGPDATDWFVRQVNTAMTDPDVLDVQSNLRLANTFASYFGLSVNQVAESGATAAVLGQEARLGSRAPARNPTISGQLASGARSTAAVAAALPPGMLSPPTGISPLPSPSSAAALAMVSALGMAALGWRALVNHAARYDFKAHADSMNHPRSSHCPDENCPPGEVGIITLCPGSNPQNCYESDLPGNLFYALIGRHIGWSELTLQLGSQYAELTDVTPRPARPVITWDTPDDTAAINLGYRLPLPLTRTALCSMIPPARSTLAARHGCEDCLDATPSRIR